MIAAYRVPSFGDDGIVSFTVCGSRYFGNLAHETRKTLPVWVGQMCEGSYVKDSVSALST